MSLRLEDYAMIGDGEAAALVSRFGSIDWLCLPRFDGGAAFANLLGTPENGRWLIAPAGEIIKIQRDYRDGTLILETDFETAEGAVRLIDFMPPRGKLPDVIRIVEGVRGRVRMRCELIVRFDYGSLVPWVRHDGAGLTAIAGPDMLRLNSGVRLHGENYRSTADFMVEAGQRIPFVLTWFPSNLPLPKLPEAEQALSDTEQWWREWSKRATYQGEWRDAVLRSLITLRALIYQPTGGIVAAPTTSLPETIGGTRNWDYRYCWLRDATFTLYALMSAGYFEEAHAWRDWLLRAAAGKPEQMQIMYGLAGEHRLPEMELPWLPGYENSRPVRIGNGAYTQFQLDIYGEMMDAAHVARRLGLNEEENDWNLQQAVMQFLEIVWGQPDAGIWEIRGPLRPFTHSRVMAWVAVDRAIKGIEVFGLAGPLERWRQMRAKIHEQVCRDGYNSRLNSFVQYYGTKELDASLLLIPQVGFLPPDDPRVQGTVRAIQRDLMEDGLVKRYRTETAVDGLPPGEGVFLPCTFWLADDLTLMGRHEEAREIFTRLLALRNDVGLLSEEYDPKARRLLGNFPQAFTHVALINTAHNLSAHDGPSQHRRSC